MNEREANTYEQLFEKIRSEIEHAEKEINETKIELDKAKKIRRNKMEYDAMAKVATGFYHISIIVQFFLNI